MGRVGWRWAGTCSSLRRGGEEPVQAEELKAPETVSEVTSLERSHRCCSPRGQGEGNPQASRQKAEKVSPCDQSLTSLMPFTLPSRMPYKIETLLPGLME